MAVELGPEGMGHRLRPINLADAAKVLELRTDPELGRFLNPTSSDIHDQERWIEAQRARSGDYYFVIETLSGGWEGVISLYGVDDGSAEWGRWVLRRGSLSVPASVMLLFRFGFDELELRRLYCRTLAVNTAVVSFHDGCPYTMRSADTYADGREYVEHSLLREDWPSFSRWLTPLAERVARRSPS